MMRNMRTPAIALALVFTGMYFKLLPLIIIGGILLLTDAFSEEL